MSTVWFWPVLICSLRSSKVLDGVRAWCKPVRILHNMLEKPSLYETGFVRWETDMLKNDRIFSISLSIVLGTPEH